MCDFKQRCQAFAGIGTESAKGLQETVKIKAESVAGYSGCPMNAWDPFDCGMIGVKGFWHMEVGRERNIADVMREILYSGFINADS